MVDDPINNNFDNIEMTLIFKLKPIEERNGAKTTKYQ